MEKPYMVVMHLGIIGLCCGALWLGATWLVESAARIAKKLGISELVIGLTVVAFGTSAPELAVTVQAALQGNADMALGNVVGSNIFNIGFILGLCALVSRIESHRSLVRRDGVLLLATMVALLVMLRDHELGRVEGLLLVSTLVAYLVYLFVRREQVLVEDVAVGVARWWDGPLLLAGLLLVVVGGRFLVSSAELLAQRWGMSQLLISLTVVAAGTSIPELAISLVAVLRQRHGISAGNLVGSNLFNTMGVLGLAGVLQEMTIDPRAWGSIAAQAGLTLMVLVFLATGKRVGRWEGVILVLTSLAIWGYNIRIGLNQA